MEVGQAADALRAGGLVVFPTETFYGLAADHENARALEKLLALKGSRGQSPLALILASADEAERLAKEIPPLARRLMAEHWPGPLTLVLAARPGLHPALVSTDGGVGMRLSPHPMAAALARGLGRAVTATSANISGGPPARRVEDLDPAITAGVDLVLDGGECPGWDGQHRAGCAVKPAQIVADRGRGFGPGPVSCLSG